MAARKLKLDPICLAYSQDSILLHVESEIEVLLTSEKLRSLPNALCLEALCSGEVWVGRGNSCRIESVVTIDGADALTSNLDALVESIFKEVGNLEVSDSPCAAIHLADLDQMWNYLGLSAVLHLEDSSGKGKVASVALRHSQLSHTSSPSRQPWSVTSDDFSIPNAVPRVDFQRLQIRFYFQTGKAAENIPKTLRNLAEALRRNEPHSNLQRDHGFHQDSDFRFSESANAKVNQNLTGLLMHCTESLTTAVNSFVPILLSISPRELPTSSPVKSFNSATPPGKLLRRRSFSKEAVDILMAWVEHRPQSQKPSLQDRRELALRTGLEPSSYYCLFRP
ncbi:hypothetical protein CJF31_00003411 [Rutstroemia sp. NJR-2017a BVV2]|nr:hypothetical protein CJF31_00003411 [Rutstroemia sp. NJR-2017a BVV2]